MRNSRGFTLIEILVVITIIAALMGMVMVLYNMANEAKMATITTTRMGEIGAGLEELKSPQLLGRYPSADMTLLRDTERTNVGKTIGKPNDLNLGIEVVYVLLNLTNHGVAVDVDDAGLGNTDGDMMAANPTRGDKKDLYEFVDAWGNPYAYFSAKDYKAAKEFGKYQMSEEYGGLVVNALPWKSKKKGTFVNPGGFQLFSAGPDGIFNTEDDIKNW